MQLYLVIEGIVRISVIMESKKIYIFSLFSRFVCLTMCKINADSFFIILILFILTIVIECKSKLQENVFQVMSV